VDELIKDFGINASAALRLVRPTLVLPGCDETTGEKLAPAAGEENAA
jgi:hypothetical protein